MRLSVQNSIAHTHTNAHQHTPTHTLTSISKIIEVKLMRARIRLLSIALAHNCIHNYINGMKNNKNHKQLQMATIFKVNPSPIIALPKQISFINQKIITFSFVHFRSLSSSPITTNNLLEMATINDPFLCWQYCFRISQRHSVCFLNCFLLLFLFSLFLNNANY